MLILIYIFGHVLIVNSRCEGRCYVKKLIPLCILLKFYTHLGENSARSFQNVFDQSSRVLRTFARKFSNIDFSLRILPLKDDELAMSEMYKKWGVTDFVLERTCREERPKSAKSGFVT